MARRAKGELLRKGKRELTAEPKRKTVIPEDTRTRGRKKGKTAGRPGRKAQRTLHENDGTGEQWIRDMEGYFQSKQ